MQLVVLVCSSVWCVGVVAIPDRYYISLRKNKERFWPITSREETFSRLQAVLCTFALKMRKWVRWLDLVFGRRRFRPVLSTVFRSHPVTILVYPPHMYSKSPPETMLRTKNISLVENSRGNASSVLAPRSPPKKPATHRSVHVQVCRPVEPSPLDSGGRGRGNPTSTQQAPSRRRRKPQTLQPS